jgi:hypothetical protein
MQNNKDQRDNPMKPTRFWIIGAGRFGRIAVERISRHQPDALLTIVDKQLSAIHGDGCTIVHEDGIQWLHTMLQGDAAVDMIVPAIPVHVVLEWLILKLMKIYDIIPIPIPDSWLSKMPNAIRGKTGQAYVSHADFICPDNCPEPEKICTHTGKPRPLDLFRLLGDLDVDDVLPIIIRSHQMLPGVGGIFPADLTTAMEMVVKNSDRPLMIATSCRCHGVVDFIRLEKKAHTARSS